MERMWHVELVPARFWFELEARGITGLSAIRLSTHLVLLTMISLSLELTST